MSTMDFRTESYVPVPEAVSLNKTSFMSSLSDPLNRLTFKDLGNWLRNFLQIDFSFSSPEEVAKMDNFGVNFTSFTNISDTRTTDNYVPPVVTNGFRNKPGNFRDQFAWGAIVCAAVFLIVLACVVTAWWVHKKQQDFLRQRIAAMEARRGSSHPPLSFMLSRGRTVDSVVPPPSYVEVINERVNALPPSYTQAMTRKQYTCFTELKHSQSFLESDIKDLVNIPDDPIPVLNPDEHREIILDAHDLTKEILQNALPPFEDSRSHRHE